MDIASLGMRIDAAGVSASWPQLDKLAASALAAETAAEAMARAYATGSQSIRDSAAAAIANTQTLLANTAARKQATQAVLASDASARQLAAAKGRLTQLEDYEQGLNAQLASQVKDLTTKQEAYNAAIAVEASARQRATAAGSFYASSFQSGLNQNLGVGMSTGMTAADVAAYGAQLDSLRAKYNPVFAASKQYEAEIENITQAFRVGAIPSQMEYEAALERARLGFEGAASPADKFGNNLLLAGRRAGSFGGSLSQLSFQINDVVSGVAMGQAPFQILAQQGGQIFQVWQMNPGIFQELKTAFVALLTPANLVIAGIAAIAGGFLYLEYDAQAAQKAIETSLIGAGRAAGVTASQLNMMAVQAHQSSGISVSSAREVAEAYASSGLITGQSIGRLTALTQDYAATTHQSTDDASKALVQIFSNLGTGVETLNKQLGGITPGQERYIQNLLASGQNEKAVKAAMDAMQPSLAHYRDQLSTIGKAWDDIKKFASGAMTAAENAIAPDLSRQIAALKSQQAAMRATGYDTTGAGGVDDLLAKLEAKQSAQQAKAASDSAAQAANRAAGTALPNVLSATTEYADLAALQIKLNSIKNIIGNPQAIKATGLSLGQITDAQQAYTHAIQTYLTPAQRAQKQTELDTAALYAKTPAQKAAIAAQQVQLNLSGQAVRAGTLEAQANSAAAQASAESAYQLSLESQQTQISIAGSIALASAYGKYGAAALLAQARTQALAESLTNGVNVTARTRELFTQAVAEGIAQQSQDIATQQRSADVTKDAVAQVNAGSLAYDRMNDFISQHVAMLQLEDLRKAAVLSGNKALIDQINTLIAAYPKLIAEQQASADAQARLAALNPNASDIRLIQGLQGQPGSQAAIAGTSLRQSQIGVFNDLAQNNAFGVVGQFGLKGGMQAANDNASQQQKTMEDAQKAGLISMQELADARIAIEQQTTDKLLKLNQAYYDNQLALGQTTFDSLATGLGDMFGKQSAEYKAAFAVEKAFQIARATLALETSIAQAAAAPWPVNIPAIAAAIADAGQILSAVASVSANGFMAGGYTGSGPMNAIAGVVHGQEWVTNASNVRGNVNTLAAMHHGAKFDGAGSGTNVHLEVVHDGSTAIRYERVSDDHIRVIAKQEADHSSRTTAVDAVAASQRNPNGTVAKAMRDTVNAKRLRT